MTREEAIKNIKLHLDCSNVVLSNATKEAFDVLIPELAESEDERIRKVLVDMVKRETGFTGFPSQGQVLAYLEKQKEQKPVQEKLSYEEIVRNAEEEVNVLYPNNEEEGTEAWERRECLREHYMKGAVRAAMESLGIKEQKPAEWSEEDKRMVTGICANLTKYCTQYCNKQSEPSVTQYDFAGKKRKEIKEQCDWLESLRPSWKPSEQEKSALRTAIYVLTEERIFPKTAAQLQNILDAFDGKESRKDWKPREEQMEALQNAERLVRPYYPEHAKILAELYEQLKAL